MKNKYYKYILLALLVAIIVPQIALASWWNPFSWDWLNRIFHFQQNPVACTMEAKLCPDGTSVGREGPKCEFAECPKLIGGDKDAHGCLPSAGYSWCEVKQKCLRTWEEKCEAVSANPTAGWKTYINSQYGFEIKYPTDWKLGNATPFLATLESSDFDYNNAEMDSRVLKGSIIRINKPLLEEIPLTGYISSMESAGFVISEKRNLKVGGIDAIGYYHGYEGPEKLFVNFIKNGYFYQIIFEAVGKERQDRDYSAFNQILSTFKFTK